MSSPIDPKLVADAAFLGVVAVTFCGGLIAVLARNILHAVLGLVIAFFGVAGLYVFLGSEFVAAMQLLIYVGAVCIAIMFAIMLSEPLYKPAALPDPMKVGLAAGVAAVIFGIIALLVLGTEWLRAVPTSTDWSAAAIGRALLTRYVVVFELISIVLLVAIIGAITTARRLR
jgi:NADH:ubiquinone oxidoreductase subunit 6 (subunit J)